MPSKLEEAVVDARRFQAQHLAPDCRQLDLRRAPRIDARRFEVGPDAPRLRERRPVHLAIGRQRQRLERDEKRGDHRSRQARREKGPQLLLRRDRTGGGHQIGDQDLLVRGLTARDDHHLPHRGVRRQRRLDLARLDAKAADLHLAVDPSDEFDAAIGAGARQIAGAVEPGPRLNAPRIGNEALRRDVRTVQVSARHSVAAGVQLAHFARRQRPHSGIQHERLGIRDRPPDRHGRIERIVRADQVAAGEDGILRRAVSVDQPAVRQLPQHLPHRRHRKHIASGQQLAHRAQLGQMPVGQLAKEARGEPEGGDPLPLDESGQLRERGGGGRMDDEPRPVEQTPPDFKRRRIEADGGELEEDLPLGQLGEVGPLHQTHDIAVGGADPLGPPGRPRGVHHVGQVSGHGTALEVVGGPARQGRLLRIDQDDPPG